MDLDKLAQSAIEKARSMGAGYADFRYEESTEQSLNIRDTVPELINQSSSNGFSVRLLTDGAWGFAAESIITEDSILKAVEAAVKIAKASASINKTRIELAPSPAVIDDYVTPVKKDPFEIPLQEKLAFLFEIEQLMKTRSMINSTSAFLTFTKTYKYFVSLAGSKITQTIYQAGCGAACGVVQSHRNRTERSYPTSGGQWITGGYEIVDQFNFNEDLPEIAREAVTLINAKECPQDKRDLVLSSDLVSLQIHESIGHPLELDRVFGYERNFSGISFATPDKLDNLQYGAKNITVVCDSTAPGGLATYAYDDEGVKAERSTLIDKGVLVNYLSDRETAQRVGKKSTACCRAAGWMHVPIVRIPNVLLLPGDVSLEQMIADVKKGIYIATPNSWSIDDNREGFTLGGEIGREIKNGKFGDVIKSPRYSGNTVDFWNSCEAIGNEKEWTIWGTPNCGKGQPGQNARTAQGTSPALFRKVKIG